MTRKGRSDRFYQKAKSEGYTARSVYKLEEIDQKYRLFRKGHLILDLGASPGSWMQYLSGRVGEKGLIVGVDRNLPRQAPVPSSRFLQRDVFDVSAEELRGIVNAFDAVVSDLAARTTGDRDGDHTRSMALCGRALELALQTLKPGGAFVCKMFQGGGSKVFLDGIRKHFDMVKTQKPSASRGESREVFVVALGFRAHPVSRAAAGS